MRVFCLSLLLLSCSAWSNQFFDFDDDDNDGTQSEAQAQRDSSLSDVQSLFEAFVNDINETAAAKTTTIALSVGSGKEVAKLDLTMNQVFENSGRNAAQIFDVITNITFFNAMAETVRSSEGGSAYQNTVKTASSTGYYLTTDAWGFKSTWVGDIKITAGASRSHCVKSQPTASSIELKCSKDGTHSGTNKMMKSSSSILTCTQNTTSSVSCFYKISMEPYQFSLFTKYMSGNEVAFRSAMRAIRTNMGLFSIISTNSTTVGAAYKSYNVSDVESKLTTFGSKFDASKNASMSFAY